MTAPVQTPFPHPGDDAYVDHAAIALSRLPQQFRGDRQEPPTRPFLVISAACGITVDPVSSAQVVTVLNPAAALELDCALLVIVSDDVAGIPDPLLMPDGWETLVVRHTDNEQIVTVLRHFVLPYEDEHTQIFLSGGGAHTQAGLLIYRYLAPSAVLVAASAIDIDAPLTTPNHFLCPSQQTTAVTDLYLGVAWFMSATSAAMTFPAGSDERLRATQSVSGTPTTMVVFDKLFSSVGSTGTQDLVVSGTPVGGVAASIVLRFDLPEFDTLNNIGRLVSSLCRPIQSLWDTMMQVLLQRSLSTAVGAQLDVIGRLVGRARNGLDDETYRRYCRATIAAHRSRGTVDELASITNLVLFDPSVTIDITPQQVATVTVDLFDIGITDDLAEVVFLFLRQAASAGVRVILRYGNTTPVFRFDLSPGLDQGRLGGEISD